MTPIPKGVTLPKEAARDTKRDEIIRASDLLPPLAGLVEQYARPCKGEPFRSHSSRASEEDVLDPFDLYFELGTSGVFFITPKGKEEPQVECRVVLIQDKFIRFRAYDDPTRLPDAGQLKVESLANGEWQVEASIEWMLAQGFFHEAEDDSSRGRPC